MARNFFSISFQSALLFLQMQCENENCEEKATVHFTQLVDGEVKKMSLCEACAEEAGLTDLSGFGLTDELIGSKGEPIVPSSEDVCSVCGFTPQKFQQVGRLGCSECYQSFSEDIIGRLSSMHRGLFHIGRSPAGAYQGSQRAKRLQEMEKTLRDMVANENYEEAARLRDEIRKLQEEEVEA